MRVKDNKININVDPYTRAFIYTVEGGDGSTINVYNGDRLVWILDHSITSRNFQVDFGKLNPFQIGTAIAFRGVDSVISTQVHLPKNYGGNLVFEYSICLGNGWRDDPNCHVSPGPPPDRLHADEATIYLNWTDEAEPNLVLSSTAPSDDDSADPGDTSVSLQQGNSTAILTWQWHNADYTPDFTLTFDNYLGSNTIPSVGSPPSISLSIPVVTTNFTVRATTQDQNYQREATAELAVSAASSTAHKARVPRARK